MKRLKSERLASLSDGSRATPGRLAKWPFQKRPSRRWRGKESLLPSRDRPRMSAYCRFEILLPLEFNDGRPVPREFLAEAAIEIQRRFGGVSWESQAIEGIWRQGGVEYRDRLNRIFVDAEDTDENRQFFIGLKSRLKSSFQQLDIWLTVHPVEIL
jgi:hypothetical protein